MSISQATPFERLQPCLFKRLTDDEPKKTQEGRVARIVSLSDYRAAVVEDLRRLLNSNKHVASEGLEKFPEVESSVFNFGISNVSGMNFGEARQKMKSELERAVRLFEPRLLGDSLEIRTLEKSANDSPTMLFFEIEATLWARPFPEKLFIKTALDLETGVVKVS